MSPIGTKRSVTERHTITRFFQSILQNSGPKQHPHPWRCQKTGSNPVDPKNWGGLSTMKLFIAVEQRWEDATSQQHAQNVAKTVITHERVSDANKRNRYIQYSNIELQRLTATYYPHCKCKIETSADLTIITTDTTNTESRQKKQWWRTSTTISADTANTQSTKSKDWHEGKQIRTISFQLKIWSNMYLVANSSYSLFLDISDEPST